jgi:hypothetical protein
MAASTPVTVSIADSLEHSTDRRHDRRSRPAGLDQRNDYDADGGYPRKESEYRHRRR